MKKFFTVLGFVFFMMIIQPNVSQAIILVPTVDGTIFDFDNNDTVDFINTTEGVQVLNSLSLETRGIVEYDISSVTTPVSNAFLRFYLADALGPFPIGIDVYSYMGDLAVTEPDYFAGNLVTSFDHNNEAVIDVDLTVPVQDALANAYTVLGINLRKPQTDIPIINILSLSQALSTNLLNAPAYVSFASLEQNSPIELHVTNSSAVIPEPLTIYLLGSGILGAFIRRRLS
jgi:hypothetical protein